MERFENPNSRQQTLPMWLLQPRKAEVSPTYPISIQSKPPKTDTTRFAAPGQAQYLTAGAAGQKTRPTPPARECATGDVHTPQHHQLQPIRMLKKSRFRPKLSSMPFPKIHSMSFFHMYYIEAFPIFFSIFFSTLDRPPGAGVVILRTRHIS